MTALTTTMNERASHRDAASRRRRAGSSRGCARRVRRRSQRAWPASSGSACPWFAFALLLLVPDVSAIGYLRGPRVGAFVYNLVHDLATGVVVAGIGLALGVVPVAAAGAILVAHSGMDRVAGYGLKLPTSFQDTHLGRIGRDH